VDCADGDSCQYLVLSEFPLIGWLTSGVTYCSEANEEEMGWSVTDEEEYDGRDEDVPEGLAEEDAKTDDAMDGTALTSAYLCSSPPVYRCQAR
jgi:hypothetical protein